MKKKSRYLLWTSVVFLIAVISFTAFYFWQKRIAQTEYLDPDFFRQEKPHALNKPDGWLVYESRGGIWKRHSSSNDELMLSPEGRYPRWSPDGKKIAYISGPDIVVMDGNGKDRQLAAKGKRPGALCFHPRGDTIIYSDERSLFAARLKQHEVKQIVTGIDARELDMAGEPAVLLATVKTMTGFQVGGINWEDDGRLTILARGCSASLSPNGRYGTVNSNDHKWLDIYDIKERRRVYRLPAPGVLVFDNHFWSNRSLWLVATVGEQRKDISLFHISGRISFPLTANGTSDRGDFYVTVR